MVEAGSVWDQEEYRIGGEKKKQLSDIEKRETSIGVRVCGNWEISKTVCFDFSFCVRKKRMDVMLILVEEIFWVWGFGILCVRKG